MAESSPRFRIRFEDGSELPVNSVEGLARRLTRGDILPDTEIFDVGTGGWGSAGQSPVVRFILDELVRDGFLLPAEWEDVPPSDGQTAVDTRARASEREEEAEVVSAPIDPLDLKLTVPPDVDEDPDPEGEDAPMETAAGRPGDDEWVTPSAEGGLLAGSEASDPGADAVGAAGENAQDRISSERGPAGGRRPTRRYGRRRPRWVSVAASLAAVLLLVVIVRFGGRPGADRSDPVEAGAPGVVAPDGLEDVAEAAAARLSGRMLAVADSVRAARELDRTPPEVWLTGPYLAGADSFSAVRAYWETYGAFLRDLRVIDAEQISAHLADAADVAPPGRRDDLDAYLEARRQQALPRRAELFDQLESATREALDLHDFLVAEAASIRYTPALGTNEVPRDPVLEIASDSAEILEALGDRLDGLFRALDRSRGGGSPEMSGLGTDLFRGFGLF